MSPKKKKKIKQMIGITLLPHFDLIDIHRNIEPKMKAHSFVVLMVLYQGRPNSSNKTSPNKFRNTDIVWLADNNGIK